MPNPFPVITVAYSSPSSHALPVISPFSGAGMLSIISPVTASVNTKEVPPPDIYSTTATLPEASSVCTAPKNFPLPSSSISPLFQSYEYILPYTTLVHLGWGICSTKYTFSPNFFILRTFAAKLLSTFSFPPLTITSAEGPL